MKDQQIDQTDTYIEYLNAVRDFNINNDEYIRTVDEIAQNRKLAIQRAIDTHAKPSISRVRNIQMISAFLAFISVSCLCLSSQSNSNQTSNSTVGFLILGSLGLGAIAVILFMWSSSKIASLNSNIKEVREKANNPHSK